MSSLKIPRAWMEKLRTLQAELWLECKRRISYVEILTEIFQKVDWEALKQTLKEKGD